MEFSAPDHRYMARALQLARRGLYTTTPNPRVGCVIVREDRIIAEGWHEHAGGPHAEINALGACREQPAGATVYVSLEPCSHTGRTPPCSQALVDARVGRVVAAVGDPNPAVSGRGLQQLEAAGIATACGLLDGPAEQLNRGFFKRMREGLPFVTAKLAMSLDGRTALASGESRWITSGAARQDVHRLRAQSCAILTGSGTVLADDPQLTARPNGALAARQPLRVILDSQLRLAPTAALLHQPGQTLVFTTAAADASKQAQLEQAGAEVVRLQATDRTERLHTALHWLAHERGINEVMVEAGAMLNGSLLQAGLTDELVVYMAPLLLGPDARAALQLAGIEQMQQRLNLKMIDSRRVGQDLRLTYCPCVTAAGNAD
ncbi:diaminohydroxyphosphoribosylaminopyrimidine deaminase/5-amino-6-(5-phosphoribosylamino)uracil reductase [Methylohalomonas lacus]|uniref:Riboflavin biosynthesis protein RibD n=1 Tax=Methylohalomonas lacus TaxID=398773 RepID=A0AAE3L3L0_9GAMM|nr:bifunctional diaminohydroxyphosphoribosylaminopyrimidine deaminase/5-amino-6-(5-phosphoribosylamino)uracil reductase RibD [Methylohalomonas lacus]MCS3902303.1 diaminohydroxyphosphoribosylaminopyrimidine deaminase/5-amino-6-(5-phosphoribosylamino)uracil reductase [Methylohalomonas lacus]